MKTTKFYQTDKIPLVVGDIHGMYDALIDLLVNQAGFYWNNNGKLVSDTYELCSVGDMVDRGENSLKVLDLKIKFAVLGNHDWKLLKYLVGKKVYLNNGLETTVDELNYVSNKKIADYTHYLLHRPLQLVINDKYLIVHGGMRNKHFNAPFKYAMNSNLFGCPTGLHDENGFPIRDDWWKKYKLPYKCIYGHTPVKEVFRYKNTINIDTGAVYGGYLTAYDPENDIIYQVKTHKPSTNIYVP